MIIIAENKKNHYLIKDFINDVLKENNEYDGRFHQTIPNREQADTVLDTPVYNDDITVLDTPVYNDDDIIEDVKVLDKIIKKQPKFSGIKSLAKKGLITLGIAAALWSAAKNNIDISDSATGSEISVSIEEQAKEVGVSITNDEIKHALNTSVNNNKQITTGNTELSTLTKSKSKENKKASKNKSSREEIKKLSSERIKAFESYRPYPYQDVEGISIGYGTQFINKGKVALFKAIVDVLGTPPGIFATQ